VAESELPPVEAHLRYAERLRLWHRREGIYADRTVRMPRPEDSVAEVEREQPLELQDIVSKQHGILKTLLGMPEKPPLATLARETEPQPLPRKRKART
jgi:hypothetical protein